MTKLLCLLSALFLPSLPFLWGQSPERESSDPALQPATLNLEPGREYREQNRIFQGIPGIEISPNGRLWATWYGGGDWEGPDNYVMLASSDDQGKSWSELKLVVDPPGEVRAFDPCLWMDPSDRLWLFWAQAYHFWDGRGGVWAVNTSQPDLGTPDWSAPVRIADGVMMNKPLILEEKTWLLPVAVWNIPLRGGEIRFEYRMGDLIGSNVIASRDQGESWFLLGQAAIPGVVCDEHMLIDRRDGVLWMLARTEYGIGESFSRDRGESWSPGRPSKLNHIPKARFCIRRLQSGNLVFINHSPPGGKTRSHLTAYLSEDEGETWQGGLVLDERQGVSYPDLTEGKDGLIYCIYDYSRREEKEILMAVFREEDIPAGKFLPSSRSRVLVNKATGRKE